MFQSAAPVMPQLPVESPSAPQNVAKGAEVLPRVFLVADQIGKQQLFPSVNNQAAFSHYVARMLLPHVPRWITPEERKRQEFVKHLVTKPQASCDTSDKPKQ